MIIRGANSAVTRRSGETIIDMQELLFCMTRRERLAFVNVIDYFNETEKQSQMEQKPTKMQKR